MIHLTDKDVLLGLRHSISFLKLIPDKVYFRLDVSEFQIPGREVNKARKELEKKTGHFVMTYNSRVFNLSTLPERHLCANLKEASLTTEQRRILHNYEKKFAKDFISFVVYEKPLKILNPRKSSVYKFYKERGLIL